MKRIARWLSPRSTSLVCSGLLFAAACGCQQAADVDRAAYEEPAEPTSRRPHTHAAETAVHSAPPENHRSASVPRSGVLSFADHVQAEPPLTQAVATPLPARIVSTAEAEYESMPSRAAARGQVAMAAPSYAVTPSMDAGAALRQAEELNRRAAAAVAKGAWFTARTDFFAALQQVATALDARENSGRRGESLTTGLTALTEAEAFGGRGPLPVTAMQAVLSSHRTAPFVGPFSPNVAPTVVREAYLKFAAERLADATVGTTAGSSALHGLGKVHNAADSTLVDARAKARVFYEAALLVGPGNILAANDLAVLLAEEGRLEQARDLLHAALRQSPQPAIWNNLAAVHDRLGQPDMAHRARRESAALEQRALSAPGSVLPTHNVAWLDPRTFAATSRPGAEIAAGSPAAVGAVRPASAVTPTAAAAKPTTGVAQRPVNRALAY